MIQGILNRKPHIALVITGILTLLQSYMINAPILGGILLTSTLLFGGICIGPHVLKHGSRTQQTIIGSLVLLSLVSITGSVIYYTIPSTKIAFNILLLVLVCTAALFYKPSSHEQEQVIHTDRSVIFAFTGIAIIGLAAWWFNTPTYEITESIRSVWHIIPPVLIISLAIAFFSLAHITKTGRVISLPITIALFFSAVSLASYTFPLGYGFDPFIHRATVQHILDFGTITPKPLYYIGQYALEITANHVFSLPLSLVDRYLAPLLASTFLIGAGWVSFSQLFERKSTSALLSLFLLPLGIFISTTPQAISYIYTISLLLLSLPILAKKEATVSKLTLIILAGATIITHPLAGIPAGIYTFLVLLITCERLSTPVRNSLVFPTLLASTIALPAVFILQAKTSGLEVSFHPENVFHVEMLQFSVFFANHYSSLMDGLYLVIDNSFWIVLALSLIGMFFILKDRNHKALTLPFALSIVWLVNYWILSTTLEFSFLIEYERQNYAERLYILTLIFLIPYVAIAFAGIEQQLQKKTPSIKTAWVLLLTVLFIGQVYGAYPRHDSYARSAGFNVSTNDFDAVNAIHQIGGTDEYIVLANQSVSAAALESFGFKRYYKDNTVFYYPIPTGGELYQIYLEMTDNEPTQARAESAMELAGVNTAYFVVNDYWWESDRIIEYAKTQTDEWFSIGNGAITVFTYHRDEQ